MPFVELPVGDLLAEWRARRGRRLLPDGVDEHHNALVVRVKGKAVEGRANRDLIGFLEEKLNVKGLTIKKGHRSRMKQLVYETDDPEGDIERLRGTIPGIRE